MEAVTSFSGCRKEHKPIHQCVYCEYDRLRSVLSNIALGRVGEQLIMDVERYANAQLRRFPSEAKNAGG